MKKRIDEIAQNLIDLSSKKSVEIGSLDVLSYSKVVMGICIGPAEVGMMLTAAFTHAIIYAASYEYEATRACKVNSVLLRHLSAAIEKVGDVRFNGRFRAIWQSLQSDLNTQESMRRIGYMLQGDMSRLVITVIKACVDWVLRKIEGTGYMPEYARENSDVYNEIVAIFHSIVIEASQDLNFDDCIVDGGFQCINIDRLPPCEDKYDVFISYRRSDGSVYARLLRQELCHEGFRCFLDVESVANGEYDLQILSALRNAPHFLFVKTIESLNGLGDPDDHVRIELEAARYFNRNVIVVAPTMVPRDMSRVALPAEVEYLRNYYAYKFDVGEAYEFCVDQIVRCGIRNSRLSK